MGMESKNGTAIDSIFKALQDINNREVSERNERNKNKNRTIVIYLWLTFIIFMIALLLSLINKWFFQKDTVVTISLYVLILSYLMIVMQPLLMAWINRQTLKKFILNPFELFLADIENTAKIDYSYINVLLTQDLNHLKFARAIIAAEKQAIEGRTALLIGAVEKIGIFPGILAAVTTLTSLTKNQPEWVYAIAYLNPVIFFVGGIIHSTLMRLDKMVEILNYVIKQKEKV